MNLNFACGDARWPDFDNSDIHRRDGTSYVDLRDVPYPYADESADVVMISHALAQTTNGVPFDVSEILGEFYRVLKPGGWLRINEYPLRIYRDGEQFDQSELALEATRGYPPELRVKRDDLIALLREVGFTQVEEVAASDTQVEASESVRFALTHNHGDQLTFALEARK